MKVSKAKQRQADEVTREHPNHIVGSGRYWHWAFYNSAYGMASGWTSSEKAARSAFFRAMYELGWGQ